MRLSRPSHDAGTETRDEHNDCSNSDREIESKSAVDRDSGDHPPYEDLVCRFAE
jgi:hypothetical protein